MSTWRPAMPGPAARVTRQLATFHLVTLGWVLFRMPSLPDGWRFLLGARQLGYEPSRAGTVALAVVLVGALLHAGPAASDMRRRFVALPPFVQGLAYGSAFLAGYLLAPAGARFIYFQF
jgi:hypothetical protein